METAIKATNCTANNLYSPKIKPLLAMSGLMAFDANTPVRSIPTIPPTPWQGKTSNVSSIDVLVRQSTTRLLTIAEITPIAKE